MIGTNSECDLYSSTTPIAYTVTGLRGSTVVFTAAGTVSNTFGNFRTVSNPHSQDQIDMLAITLSNTAAPCCRNPMGLDNIVITATATATAPTQPTAFALTGRVTNSTTNEGISGAIVSVRDGPDGPNAGRSAATDSSGAYKLNSTATSNTDQIRFSRPLGTPLARMAGLRRTWRFVKRKLAASSGREAAVLT